MKKIKVTILFFITNLFVSILYAQAIFYVAPTGNDAYAGTIDAPWQTISKAASTLTAGQTAYVRTGTYNEAVSIKNSGTKGNIITLMAYPGETPIIDGQGSAKTLININSQSFVKVFGFRLQNAYMGISGGKSNIFIENNYVYNFTNPGISLSFCSNSVVKGNVAEKCCSTSWGECITFNNCEYIDVVNNEVKNGVANPYGGEGLDVKSSKHMRVFGNKIHDLQKLGLYLDSYDGLNYDLEVFNNLVYNCTSGIVISSEERNAVEKIWLYNNIVYNTGYCGIAVVNWPTHADGSLYPINDIIIENNTVSTSNPILIDAKNGTNFQIRNNVVYNYNFINFVNKPVSYTLENNLSNSGTLSTFGTNSIFADPKFINATVFDYQLSSSSPAIDKGKANNVAFDYDYNARPIGNSIDMGAYEYGASVPVIIPEKVKPAFSTSTSKLTESSSDAVENTSTKVVTLNGTTLTSSFTSTTNKVIAALRFSSVSIPKGATILNARIKFKNQTTVGNGADPIQIRAENTGNAPVLTNIAGSISSKTKTNSFANWLPSSSINGDYFSNSLDFIVNEVINRIDWTSGNAMTFLLEVNSTADAGRSVTFTSYDGSSTNAPQLIIEYTINSINGLDSKSSVNLPSVYPNPAKNRLFVDMRGNSFDDIAIYDLVGRLVLKKQIDNTEKNFNLDISSLAKGLHLINLRKGVEMYTSKVIFE